MTAELSLPEVAFVAAEPHISAVITRSDDDYNVSMEIDLKADLGEGAGFDAELMPLITSANVCCGLHAGGPGEIAKTLGLAHKHGVVIGAHPGYADREHFGRRELALGNQELVALCVYQLGAVDAMAGALGLGVRYVKPHGAL